MPRFALSCVTVSVLLAVCAAALSADPGSRLDPARIGWTEARLQANKFGLIGRSRLQIAKPPHEEVEAALLAAGEWNGLRPAKGGTLLVKVATNALGRDSTSRVWLEPRQGAAYQDVRIERRSGRGHYKMQRISDSGVYTLRRQSIRGGFSTSLETWERVREQYQVLARNPFMEPVVSTPTGLFYVVGAAPLDEVGDRWRIALWTRGRELVVEMKVVDEETRRVSVAGLEPVSDRALDGERVALRIALSGHWGDERVDGRGPEILGLRNVELVIDKEIRVPLEVRGRVSFLGTVRFFLRELRLASAERAPVAVGGRSE